MMGFEMNKKPAREKLSPSSLYRDYTAYAAFHDAANDSTYMPLLPGSLKNPSHYKPQLIITETITYTPEVVHGMTVPKTKNDPASGHIWDRPPEFKDYGLLLSADPHHDRVRIHEITHNWNPSAGEPLAYAMEHAPRSQVDQIIGSFTYLRRRA